MTMKQLTLNFNDHDIRFREDGWFNATAAAEKFGKRPNDWLRLPDAARYVAALEARYGKISYVKTSRARADRGWRHLDAP